MSATIYLESDQNGIRWEDEGGAISRGRYDYCGIINTSLSMRRKTCCLPIGHDGQHKDLDGTIWENN